MKRIQTLIGKTWMQNAILVRFIHNLTFSTAIKIIGLDKKFHLEEMGLQFDHIIMNKQVTLHKVILEVRLSNGINSELGLDERRHFQHLIQHCAIDPSAFLQKSKQKCFTLFINK